MTSASSLLAGALKTLVRLPIKGYQWFISPVLPPSCRFVPTCSEYALQAIERHGAGRGLWLATRRLARCHPWCDGGFDPVPESTGAPGARHHGRSCRHSS